MRTTVFLTLAVGLALSSPSVFSQGQTYDSTVVKGAAHAAVPPCSRTFQDKASGTPSQKVPSRQVPSSQKVSPHPSSSVPVSASVSVSNGGSEYESSVEKGKVTAYHAPPQTHTSAPAKQAAPAHPLGHVLTGQAEELAANSQVPPDLAPPAMQADVMMTQTPPTFPGVGPGFEDIIKTAPPLGDYETRAVSDQSYKQFLKANHADTRFQKTDVLIFKGKWDKAEHLLDECGIPYAVAPKNDLAARLRQARLVMLNCPGEIDPGSAALIRDFVERGGYLISTDWAVDGAVARMFPGILIWKGAYSMPETVDAVPILTDSKELRGIKAVAPWRLDDKCEIVELGGRGSVDVLVRSRQLSREDPNGIGILAATFKYGAGKVLHLVGHFDNNQGLAFAQSLRDPSPGIQISMRQAVAINFMCEAVSQPPIQPRAAVAQPDAP